MRNVRQINNRTKKFITNSGIFQIVLILKKKLY